MTDTPVPGFDPSTVNNFKKKLAFDVHWDEVDGKKVNPHIEVPEFSIGGLGFQLALELDENHTDWPHDVWLEMMQPSQELLLPDFEIRLKYKFTFVNWEGETKVCDEGHDTLRTESVYLYSFPSMSHVEIDLEMNFLAVFFHHVQFLNAELAKKNKSDCKLVMKDDGDKSVYVNKALLAMRSPFFETLFFGEFMEKDQDVIKLGDVTQEDFVEYLSHVYPSPNPPFIFKTLEKLLKLADRFQNDVLTWSIKKFLTEKKDKTPEEARQTLILADEYNMPQVFRSTLKTLSKKEAKVLKPKTFTKFERENLELFVTHIY